MTSDHVFVESWCLFRARLGRVAALELWDAMETGVIEVVGVRSEDLVHARDIVRKWPDQDFSLVDSTSFAVMESRAIEEALAFDVRFRLYRYGDQRRRAFRVLP